MKILNLSSEPATINSSYPKTSATQPYNKRSELQFVALLRR